MFVIKPGIGVLGLNAPGSSVNLLVLKIYFMTM